jgi:hypothetical protein
MSIDGAKRRVRRLFSIGARPLVGEDLRQGGDEVADGAARCAAVDLGFEDVDARLRHATDV